MALNMYTSDRTSPRSFPWLWYVRLLQMVVTIIILAITALDASVFSGIGCNVPSKLDYNIAAVSASLQLHMIVI